MGSSEWKMAAQEKVGRVRGGMRQKRLAVDTLTGIGKAVRPASSPSLSAKRVKLPPMEMHQTSASSCQQVRKLVVKTALGLTTEERGKRKIARYIVVTVV